MNVVDERCDQPYVNIVIDLLLAQDVLSVSKDTDCCEHFVSFTQSEMTHSFLSSVFTLFILIN